MVYLSNGLLKKIIDSSGMSRCITRKWIDIDGSWINRTLMMVKFSAIKTRRRFYWVNDLSRADIIELFRGFHMYIKNETLHLSPNNNFMFGKEESS